MEEVRIPLPTSTAVDLFTGASLELHQYMQNTVVDTYPQGSEEGMPYVTQRPGFDVSIDASDQSITTNEGRGIYYWTATSSNYLVHGNGLYKGDYGNLVGILDSGKYPVSFAELGNYLIINTPGSSNRLWTVSTSDVLAEMADTDCPTNLASGIVQLDGYIFVLGTNGIIYNSDLDDPLVWNPLEIKDTERATDKGVAIIKHGDNIAALGSKTIEFFYDASNPYGSPLGRRDDVFHSIGCGYAPSVWSDGEKAFFVSVNSQGNAGIHLLEGFSLKKISTASIDSYLTTMLLREGLILRASGISGHGHEFYVVSTGIDTYSGFQSKISLVYDYTTNYWYTWKSSLNSLYQFNAIPIIATTINHSSLTVAQAQLINGDVITVLDNLHPVDTKNAASYFVEGADYVDADYVVSTNPDGANIEMVITTGFFDGGTTREKQGAELEIVGSRTKDTQNITIKWANENTESFTAGRSYDLSKYYKLTKLGVFVRRSFQVVCVVSEQVRLFALELKYKFGRYL